MPEIRKAIFDGDIDHVFKLCDEFYPNVLENNPMILFKLKCRKFIEMIRQAHRQADHADRDKAPHDAMDYDATLSEQEAQSLQVSENPPSIPVKRTTSSSSLDPQHKKKKQKIAREDLSTFVDGLAYGIELKNAYKQEAKSNRAMATELEVFTFTSRLRNHGNQYSTIVCIVYTSLHRFDTSQSSALVWNETDRDGCFRAEFCHISVAWKIPQFFAGAYLSTNKRHHWGASVIRKCQGCFTSTWARLLQVFRCVTCLLCPLAIIVATIKKCIIQLLCFVFIYNEV